MDDLSIHRMLQEQGRRIDYLTNLVKDLVKEKQPDTVSTAFVAQQTGYSAKYIQRLCISGEIKGFQRITGGKWRIPYEEYLAFKAKKDEL